MFHLSLFGSVFDTGALKNKLYFLHFTKTKKIINEVIYKDNNNHKLVYSKEETGEVLTLYSPPDTNKDRITLCRKVDSTAILDNASAGFDYTDIGYVKLKDVKYICSEFFNGKIYVRLIFENEIYFVYVFLYSENVIEDEKILQEFCDELKMHVELIKPTNNLIIRG